MNKRMWIEDDLPDEPYEDEPYRGDAWVVDERPMSVPVKRQIGFIRRKPVVRIKAWTRPIV